MSRIKCSICGKAAHTVIEGKTYCMGCIPKPTMPVTVEETLTNQLVIERHDPKSVEKVERPRPWPDPPSDRELAEDMQPEPLPTEYFKPLGKCIEKKKPWWKKII